jgi:hypothetical protein
MPIRLNLLAEAQAAEELRRRDPVKRVIWIAALLIALVLVWASSIQLNAIIANKDLGTVIAQMNACTNDYKEVIEMQKKTEDMTQKLTALHALSTNRFLNGNLLNALQKTTVADVQLLQLRLDQTYILAEASKPKTNGNKVLPGNPPTATEKIVLTLNGSDGSSNPGDQVGPMRDAIGAFSYFQQSLDPVNPVTWKNSSAPQFSPDTGKAFVTFTLECRYPEKTR